MESRQEKLERIKREIEEGTYATDHKLRVAAWRLFNEAMMEQAVNDVFQNRDRFNGGWRGEETQSQ